MSHPTKAVILGLFVLFPIPGLAGAEAPEKPTFVQFLKASAVPREVIDRFLRGPTSWARFDPELGYILGNFLPTDGIDGSATISTAVRPDGARTSFMYVDRPCRINTYGDSFTQCHQVSDGETWQEYLAAHLGEPIRNFGMGGFGVYQAYRRMIREERTDHGAKYLILYIWGDDPIRSLLRCRRALMYPRRNDMGGRNFHGNFWANVEMDLPTGRLVEKESLLQTPESLYKMCDPDWMVEHLKDDLALQLYAFKQDYIRDLDRTPIETLAARLDYPINMDDAATLKAQAAGLLDRYSLRTTRLILEKGRRFADENGKKLMVVLFDPYRAMTQMRDGGKRYDQEIVDYLAAERFNVFDMNEVQLNDYRRSHLPYDDYMKQYFIGHYNPRGNHFFAYAIKGKVVEWLDPKPITYRRSDPDSVDFREYLPGRSGEGLRTDTGAGSSTAPKRP
jgi:hypothetical protein